MPGPKGGFTTPHRCATVDSSREINLLTEIEKPDKNCRKRHQTFQITFDDNVYLSLGLEAKLDIYNTFDPNEPFDIHLDPPSNEQPPLVKIKQKGKPSVHTTDFYFTNKLPSNIAVRPQGVNNNTPDMDQAEAADPTFFDTDPLQPGEVHLHSWMLYTSQVPVLDLTGEHIKTKEDIKVAFHALFMPFLFTRRGRTEV